MSTIITPSEEQINIVVNDEKISINVESGDVIVNVTENIVEVSTVNGGYPLPTTVYSVFGRTGNIIATEGDYDLGELGDVTLVSSTNGDVLSYDGTKWINKAVTGTGTVTSVDMSVPVGLQVSGNPISTVGTLAVNFAAGYSLPTTAKQTTWDTAYNDSIVSASVSGTTTKTLTLTQQDAGVITASWTDLAASGTVTSVGASVPTGLTISGSPIVSAGVLAFGLDTGYTIPLSTQLVPTGGSEGQLLAKNSATNYDTLWIDNYTEQLRDTVKASVVINKGQAVYVSGANGTNQLVSLASNTNESLSSKTLGLASQNFAINDIGQIITEGLLAGLNTSTATAGDPVWLGVSGNLIYGLANKPVAPAHLVYIGVVTRSNINNGEIYVKIQNGFELQELHNVLISSVANNEGLFYETATSLWKNKSIATVLGYTPISLTSLSGVSPLSYNNTTGAFSIAQATTSVNGYLSSTDWTTFNGKQAALNGTGFVKATGTTISYDNSTYYLASNPNAYIALTGLSATAPLSYNNTTGGFTISQAGVSGNGYLSSTDWNTFNNKQAAGNYITALSGEATASGPGSAAVTLSTSAVTGKLLTGVNITGGSISATDSILVAFGKIQNQINGVLGGAIYQSTWNASTNSPTLTSSTGTKGYYYIVSVAGSTNLDGITDWKVGDWAIFNGTTWDKVDNTDAVSSVNGFTGAVSLTSANISEVTNLYYTEGRVSANTDVAANTAARHAAVTLGTANGLSLSTQALSLGLASTSATGALSSTDWNTFNLKQAALSGTGFVKISGSTISYDNSTYYLASNPNGYTTNVGTVTSVSALTLGTTGTDLSSTVATGTTTPVITLNVPTASATNRGALSSADWSTFNGKQAALSGTGFVKISGSTISYDNSTYLTTSSASSTYLPLTGGTLTGPLFGTSATFSGQLHIPNNSTGTLGGLYFDYNSNVASRTWQIVSDYDAYGDFQIRQSTTQTGSTYSKILGFSSTGLGTFTKNLSITDDSAFGGQAKLFSRITADATTVGKITDSSFHIWNSTNVGSLSQITFGYTNGSTTNASVYLGYISTNVVGSGFGDFVLGTAPSANAQCIERLRIASTGVSTFSSNIIANNNASVIRVGSSLTTLGESRYLNLSDYYGNANARMEIGLGYSAATGVTNVPALIGFLQTSSVGYTYGDLYFATRNVTTDTAPTVRLTIASTGGATFSYNVITGGSIYVGGTQSGAMSAIYGASNYIYYNQSAASAIQVANTNTVTNGSIIITNTGGTGSYSIIGNAGAASGYGLYIQSQDRTAAAYYPLLLQPNGANVLIGTTTDSVYKLDVNGTGRFYNTGGSNTLTISGTGSPYKSILKLEYDSSSYGATLTYDANPESVTLENYGRTGSGTTQGDINFRTKVSNTTPTNILNLDGFTGNATFYGSVTATGFFESSDSRLKTLIQDNYQTKGIASITPKLYTKNGKVELGYYAQDFVGILDSAVSKGSDDMLSLSYREVLVAKVYALEQRIKELETK